MKTETIKISFSPKKIIYFLVVAGVVIFVFLWFAMKENKLRGVPGKQKEIVLPSDFGVSDPGFEGKVMKFVTLNAKASIDAREKFDGKSSLKLSFSEQPIVSVKVPGYISAIDKDGFYRLGFWVKSDLSSDKKVFVRVAEKENMQSLGNFFLNENEDGNYVEFNFQAVDSAQDLIFVSDDGVSGDIWIDDVRVEKLDVNSVEELSTLAPTIAGNTTWKNVDKSQRSEGGDSGDFLSRPGRKMGQVFQPAKDTLSGVSFKVLRHGTGGVVGAYQVQLREFDGNSGTISDDVIASTTFNQSPSPAVLDSMKMKEQRMREEFTAREQDIKDGRIQDDKDDDQYPVTFDQNQINIAKATKRAAKLEVDIRDMKESFNLVEEVHIPLATRIDSGKKYWIGVGNVGATIDLKNYISIAVVSPINKSVEEEEEDMNREVFGGFASESSGAWTDAPALWFETFYPEHHRVGNDDILSGATISDMGEGKSVYRYGFAFDDAASLSGFSGRKVYDMIDGSYDSISVSGNYKLSYDDFSTYRFNTIYPVSKIIVRDVRYHQSLALEISTDGESWEEVYSENPAADTQSIDPIIFTPDNKTTVFYLRIKPSGDSCVPYGLSVEAELEK